MKQFLNPAPANAARPGPRRIIGAMAAATSLIITTFAPTTAIARQRGEDAAKPAATPKGPLLLIVSTDRQRISVWSADGKVTEAPVSTGRSGYETPHGIFSVLGKETEHFSNLYDDAPMPYMQRLTWSGVALHAGRLPGYAASHGCVRLPHGFSKSLFGITEVGTRVLVVDEDVSPRAISHPRLFTPLPAAPAAMSAGAGKPATIIASIGSMQPASNAPTIPEEPDALAAPKSGVAVANAADEVPPARRTRATIAAERAAALTAATGKVTNADARTKELAPQAKAAAVAAFEAVKAQRVARIAADRAAEDTRKLEARFNAAKSELSAFAARRERIADTDNDEAMDKAAQRESEMEARLTALADDLAKARAGEAQARIALDRDIAQAQKREVDKAAAAGALKGALEAQTLAKAALEKLKREEANRARPISVLISRKTGKLYVRQGFEELFETSVDIAHRDQPLGMHLFTATGKAGSGDELRWSVVTLQGGRESPVRPRKSRRGGEEAQPAVFEPTTAARALDRITIPPEAMERIAEHVKPGSSLIIADDGPSRETGKGTDFVMLTR